MAVRIRNSSRLQFVDLVRVDGVEFWEVQDLPTIPVQFDDIQYQIRDFDRIDLLAGKYYGDPVLWWVIAVANDMEIIPTDFVSGTQIRIPSPRYITTKLLNKR